LHYVREKYDIYPLLVTDGEKGGDAKVRIKEAEAAYRVSRDSTPKGRIKKYNTLLST